MKLCTLIILFAFTITISAQDITSLPYQTSFEGVEGNLNENFPQGWSAEDLNLDVLGNQGWQIIKNSDFAQNARTDSTAVHMFSNTSEANDDWLFTPSFNVTEGLTYNLKFWYKVNAFNSFEKLKVHAGTSAIAMNMATTQVLWDEDNLTNTEYMEGQATFTAESDEIMHFGFHYYSDEFQFILLLDDIEIDIIIPGGSDDPITAPKYSFNYSENGDATFYSRDIDHALINITDMSGRKIKSQKSFSNEGSLNISTEGLPKGLYLVSLFGINEDWKITEKVLIN